MKGFVTTVLMAATAAAAPERPDIVPIAENTELTPAPQTTPEVSPAEDKTQQTSPGEQRIRAGIVLLGVLHDTLARVQDTETAEAAVPDIMRLAQELQVWGQGFAALPPLDENTQSEYEKKYLPIINKINERLRIQAERVAAAEFYGSENLPAALVGLVNSVQ